MDTTRAHKERFILSFGKITGVRNDAVDCVLSVHGLEVFPDWAIDLMVTECIDIARSAAKRNRENRAITAAHLARHTSKAA